MPILAVRRISTRVSFCFSIGLSVLSLLVGCLQETSSPSRDRTVSILTRLLCDPQPETRRTAVEALGKIGDRSTIMSVTSLLKDPSPVVRAAAAKAVGRIGSSSAQEAIVMLAQALEDPADPVRQAAAVAIGDIEPDSSGLGPVIRRTRSPDARTRYAAVLSLLQVEIGSRGPELISLLHDPDERVRQAAAAILGASSDPMVTVQVRNRLVTDNAPGVRAEIGYQAGKSLAPDTRVTLELAIRHETDNGVRRWIEAELRSLREYD